MNLRQFKPIHWLYNLLHYKQLRHNKEAYERYNIKKSLVTSISSKDFPDKESKAWLDTGNSSILAPSKSAFNDFKPAIRQSILDWSENGYIILNNFFDEARCDRINAEIDQLLNKKKIHFQNGNKLMFVHKKSAVVNAMANEPALLSILQFLLDRDVVAFQTINFLQGSQQRAHSDSIHMTTYPLGYLIAAWIALEDVNHTNGPLFYYPGSHKLPYLLNSDFNEGETTLRLGKKDYRDYEDVLEDSIRAGSFIKKEFHAKKGDVLIWHANLVHGGMPIININSTRKSMVVHYYATDVIKYHEITERPSLL